MPMFTGFSAISLLLKMVGSSPALNPTLSATQSGVQRNPAALRDEIRTSLTLSKTPSRLKLRTLADLSRLRLCLVNRYIQSLSRVCIVWIESQYLAEFHNSISPPAEPA